METIILLLKSQLHIEKAKLKSYNKDYASHSEICYPLINATEAAIIAIKKQLETFEN